MAGIGGEEGAKSCYLHYLMYLVTGEEAEAWRGEVTCPRSHRQ